MCGIFAVYSKNNLSDSNNYYDEFRNILFHRGPDAQKSYYLKNVYLGFNRLKIIDLSDKANMPMQDNSGRYVLVFNGQIYNYKILKKKFLNDCEFETNSDSEVILQGYKKYGKEFFKEMDGMWAIIIYDKKLDKLIISRDRLGVKFLYYCIIDQEIFFSSEQKVLISLIKKKSKFININLNYAINYIVKGNNDFKNETLYKDIFLLEEGHVFEYKNELKSLIKLFDFNFEKKNIFDQNRFNKFFIDNISKYSNSDVPIASTLSSGLDSSSIYFTLKNILKKKVKSFSFKFNIFFDSESHFTKERIERYRVDNKWVIINQKDIKNKFDQFLDMMDEPFVSDNMFYQSLLAKEVNKQGCKVLFVGDGADEFFLGYKKYIYIYLSYILKKFRFKNFFQYLSQNNQNITFTKFLIFKIKNFFYKYGERDVTINLFGKKIIKPKVLNKIDLKYYKINKNFDNALEKEIYTRFKFDIIRFNKNLDITGMMHSIEIRVPFLDHKLINYALSTNYEQHFLRGTSKNIIRNYVKENLYLDIANQTKKFHKPGSIGLFVYEFLDNEILTFTTSEESKKIFNENVREKYLKDKNERNIENSFVWFRYYQIIKLIYLKGLKIDIQS